MGEGKAGIVCLYIQILVFYIQNKILLCWFREVGMTSVSWKLIIKDKLLKNWHLKIVYTVNITFAQPVNKIIIFQNKSLVS